MDVDRAGGGQGGGEVLSVSILVLLIDMCVCIYTCERIVYEINMKKCICLHGGENEGEKDATPRGLQAVPSWVC